MQRLDDADEGGSAEHHWRRALHDLDALDIGKIQGCDSRIECPTPGHAVDHEQEGIELVQTPECGHCARGPGIPTGGRFDARNEAESGCHIMRVEGLYRLSRND